MMEPAFPNGGAMRTIGNATIRRRNRLHELVSIDSDDNEPEHQLDDIGQRDPAVGRLSTGVATSVSTPNARSDQAIPAQNGASSDEITAIPSRPEEMDLADLKHLATLVSAGGGD